jgi:hypothetical protein
MDNRQCIGLDKFHQCLSTLFPSNNDNVEGGGGGGGGDVVDGSEVEQESSGAGIANPDRDSVSVGTDCDRDRPRRHSSSSSAIPVRFTKTAVELLRESLNAFLRRVGRDLLEELDAGDPMSQHPIRPEDVVKVILALDGDNETTTAADTATSIYKDDVSNGERTSTTTPNTILNDVISYGEMKELVSQAQDLLLQRKRQNQKPKRLNKRKISTEPKNDDDPTGVDICRKESMGGSGCGPDHKRNFNNNNNKTKSASTNAAGTTLSAEQQQQQQQPKKKKRKRKKQKLIVTAEMEAEQERLLNASKKVFDMSRQQQNGGGDGSNDAPAFRVELS